MTFRSLLLAQKWTPKVDPSGYWMSPKLDGIRAYWDGEGTLWSRLGKPFKKAPAEFIARLPSGIPLDGELYLGPGRFNDTVRAVKGHAGWEELRYMVFDAPDDVVQFEERTRRVRAVWDDWTPQTLCASIDYMLVALRLAESIGLEGIMLRKPGSLYEGKRSRTLLKVKSFLDCEATVEGTHPGEGKHAGRLGALVCRLDSGKIVDVGTGLSDLEREMIWTHGTRITIRYQELTPAGIPRFPVFVAIRDYE